MVYVIAVVLEFNKDLLWSSDWDGEDVGFEDVSVVGLYRLKNTELYFYIDMETNKILAGWEDLED